MWNRNRQKQAKAIVELAQRVKVAEDGLVILRGYTTALLAIHVATLNSMRVDDRLNLNKQLKKLISEPFKLTGTSIWPMNEADASSANDAFSQMVQIAIRILEAPRPG
jgi:hypothetical protein